MRFGNSDPEDSRQKTTDDGLANSPRPLPIARIQSDTTISDAPTWEEIQGSASTYAPKYAPSSEPRSQSDELAPKLVCRRLDEVRPHSSYVRKGLSPSSAQLAALNAMGELAFRDPVVITQHGVIVDGYARYALARRHKRETIWCLELDLTEEEALRLLIKRHQPAKGLNDFDLALLALELGPPLRNAARTNQQWGGRNKGSSSDLTEAQTIDVRSEIAACAGISPGTLDKVKEIDEYADSKIKGAIRTKEISIHRASKWCRLPVKEQPHQLEQFRSRKGVNAKSRQLIRKHVQKLHPAQLIPPSLAELLTPIIPDSLSALHAIAVVGINAPGSVAYFTKDALRILKSAERRQ